MDEMAWGGNLGIVRDDSEEQFIFREEPPDKLKRSMASAEKYARSERFAQQAIKLYSNFPLKIWTAPFIGSTEGTAWEEKVQDFVDLGRRFNFYDISPEGLQILESLGFESLDKIDPQNDFVVLYASNSVDGGSEFMASPWIIMHTIIDGMIGTIRGMEFTGRQSLVHIPEFNDYWRSFVTMVDDIPDITMRIHEIFTMKSMRSIEKGKFEEITNLPEIAYECVVQELIDSRGFFYNKSTLSPDEIEIMNVFKIAVKKAAEAFRSYVRGKMVAVATYVI